MHTQSAVLSSGNHSVDLWTFLIERTHYRRMEGRREGRKESSERTNN